MPLSISYLLEGNCRFREGRFKEQRPLYESLALDGQFPQALIITCSDSRILTDEIFDAAPGTCFVIRNVGGFVPPYQADEGCHGTTAAIEFAVSVLKVRAAVVLAHSQCAGVAKACAHDAEPVEHDHPNIVNWLSAMELPKDMPSPHEAEREAARISLRNLSDIPCVKGAKARGELELAALRFDISTGEVEDLGA